MFKRSKRCKACGKMKKHAKGGRVCIECRKDEIALASVRQLSPIKGSRTWRTLWLKRPNVTVKVRGRDDKWYDCDLVTFDGRDLYYRFPYGQIVRVR